MDINTLFYSLVEMYNKAGYPRDSDLMVSLKIWTDQLFKIIVANNVKYYKIDSGDIND